MVPPAPDARTFGAITPIRTKSLPATVSVAGKRDFQAREKSAKTSPEPQIRGLRDRVVLQEPRQLRAFATTFRNSPQTVNCVVADAVPIEPVSLHLGQMQGDSRKMQRGRTHNLAKSQQISIVWRAPPYSS